MDNSFGGMSEEEFLLGWDAMIDEDDPDSINYDPWEHDYHSLDYEEKNYRSNNYQREKNKRVYSNETWKLSFTETLEAL